MLQHMQLSWHGQYTIKVVSKETTLILDPSSRLKADILSFSNPSDPEMSNISGATPETTIIDTPGEYSLRHFTLHSIGWNTEDGTERNLQRWMIEDIVLLHVGALNRDLNEQELRELELVDIDVLFAPIGGGNGMTKEQAMKMITTIEPRIVVPIHYAVPGSSEKLDALKPFLEEMGVESSQPEKKLILRKSKLPQEDMQTVILAP